MFYKSRGVSIEARIFKLGVIMMDIPTLPSEISRDNCVSICLASTASLSPAGSCISQGIFFQTILKAAKMERETKKGVLKWVHLILSNLNLNGTYLRQ